MSKIVFVRPLRTLEQSYGELAPAGSTEPSQGVCSLAAVARKAGYETEIVDATMEGLSNERAAEEILSRRPKYVGLSALTATIHDAAAIARLIKERSSQKPVFSEKTGFSAGEVITIVGGVHVTAVAEETMRLFPHFDLGVLGEGEETILELLACLDSGSDLRAVKGLILRDGDRLVRTAPRPFIRDLDTLPFPAWDLLKGYPECSRPPAWCPNVGASGLVITSRGCTGKCTFCDRLCFGTTCRAHSADYVLNLVRYLKERFGVGYVRFLDDNFLLFPKRLEAICEGLLKPEMKLVWSCFGRVDTVDARRLRLMRAAGCHEIAYGIESGSQRILDLIRKEITLNQIREAVRLTHDAGIEV
ncbi:MAG: radical SAM protein, partial [Planctomycetes bacterium]|nr:radical SAM protein [Planctomycetota bacterium]